jgi:acetyl-CoA synthetase
MRAMERRQFSLIILDQEPNWIWGDPERYLQTYWRRFGDRYFAGDGAKRDDDGYYWLLGRVDDIMLISGHNISTAEVEHALVGHHAVAEPRSSDRRHHRAGDQRS